MSLSGQEKPPRVCDCASRSRHPSYGNIISRRSSSVDDETRRAYRRFISIETDNIIKMDGLSYGWKEGVTSHCQHNYLDYELFLLIID